MGDLSVKGVLRKHLGVTGDFWLKSALFPVPLPVMSVRAASFVRTPIGQQTPKLDDGEQHDD